MSCLSSGGQFVRRYLEAHLRFMMSIFQSKPMSTKIFITLPVADLPRALGFYEALGYSHDPQFTGDGAACIVISEHIHVMLGRAAGLRLHVSPRLCRSGRPLLGTQSHDRRSFRLTSYSTQSRLL